MNELVHERCFNHPSREAVARCLECSRVFCRECVTEHDDRVICASCLQAKVRSRTAARSRFLVPVRTMQFLASLLVAWTFFYLLGRFLISIPTSVHEGTFLQSSWMDEP